MSTQDIITKIHELRELQSLIDEATAEAEALKDSIKAYMGEQEELRAGEYKITWKPVETTRLDTTALKTRMPDIYELYTRKTTTRRFLVA